MTKPKTISEWMSHQSIGIADLVNLSDIDRKVVEATVAGRYTTSPLQRQRLADVIGVLPDNIGLGPALEIDHLYGHGPQFGSRPSQSNAYELLKSPIEPALRREQTTLWVR